METKSKKNIFMDGSGFTLLEILLVIGIIAVLAVVVIVALKPAQRFEDARNSRRLSDIQSILSAVQQYGVDHKGNFPNSVSDVEAQIGTTGEQNCDFTNSICNVTTQNCVDLSSDLAPYLKEMPFDPENGSSGHTRYSIQVNENNIVTVKACDSSDESIASVSR